MLCPDLGSDKFQVQNAYANSDNMQGQSFFLFTLDTCEYQQNVLPQPNLDCVSEDESIDILSTVHVTNKIATEFFSGPTYKQNDHKLNYHFKQSKY